EIKQDLQTSSTNKLALILQRVKVSEDKRKLDWILVNNKENKPDIRRVISKSKERFCTKKWLVSKEKKALQELRKQNSNWVLDMTQSLLEEIRKNNIDPEITSRRKIGRVAIETVQALISESERRGKLRTSELQKCLFGEIYKEQKE
ncbi:19891_t:CDS:2, partial [Dentiscutata erythropus]